MLARLDNIHAVRRTVSKVRENNFVGKDEADEGITDGLKIVSTFRLDAMDWKEEGEQQPNQLKSPETATMIKEKNTKRSIH